MIRKISFLIYALLTPLAAFSQLAAYQDNSALITPTFRYDIIRTKRVASLTIHAKEKPDNRPVYDNGIVHYYRFDSAAKLTEAYYTIKESAYTWDTVRSFYYYNQNNKLVTKRTNEGVFYDTWHYIWYSNGLLKKETHLHEIPDTTSSRQGFKTSAVISSDSFDYNIYPKQIQRFGSNELKKPYEKMITQYDNAKHVTGRYFQYQAGSLFSQVDIAYDSLYRVKKYTYSANLNGNVHKTVYVAYDKYSNVLSEKSYSNNKELNDTEFLYDVSTGLISYKLSRDYTKGIIEIDSFSYTFQDTDQAPLFDN